MKSTRLLTSLAGAAGIALAIAIPGVLRASDHADGPTVAGDQAADIADLYAFLDPTNNSNVILILTSHGFIVPGEGNNLALFDPAVRYTIAIENTGDAKPDLFIDFKFSERAIATGAASPSQNATITFRGAVPKSLAGRKGEFTILNAVTQASEAATAPAQIISTPSNPQNPSPGITFFAGETDDPFFFDIPGFNRFVAGVLANDPTAATNLTRGRDTFAGYNVMSIVISLPASLLLDSKAHTPLTTIGVSAITARQTDRTAKGVKVGSGPWVQVDRVGNPGVNVVFIPYNDKNAYNAATPIDDANGKFLADIAGTLTALGTDSGHIATLASVVGIPLMKPVKPKDPRGTGDYLRLDTTAPNTSVGGPGITGGFPNGRRPGDDVIDTVINLVTNGLITTGDNVNANDVPFQAAFPFLALPHQPQPPNGNDGTEN